jgi:hypothetical protein
MTIKGPKEYVMIWIVLIGMAGFTWFVSHKDEPDKGLDEGFRRMIGTN